MRASFWWVGRGSNEAEGPREGAGGGVELQPAARNQGRQARECESSICSHELDPGCSILVYESKSELLLGWLVGWTCFELGI